MCCGKEYQKTRPHQKWCSRSCANHSRWGQKAEERHHRSIERKEAVIGLYDTDYSTSEVASIVGVSVSFVLTAWRNAGYSRRPTPLQREVRRLREQGKCSTEISKELGKPTKEIRAIAKAIAMPFTAEEVQRSRTSVKNQYFKSTEQEKELYVNSFFNGDFSYVEGYKDCDSYVTIRCNKCGGIFQRSMISIRQNKAKNCPVCQRIKKDQQEKEKKARREQLQKERAMRAAEKERERIEKTRTVICPECGKIFHTVKTNVVYCSPECSRKRTNRYCTQRKDKRIPKHKRIDRGITAKRLYDRDNGICWICGEKCDLDDFVEKDGCIICGNNYPSVDHITPICEGGADSWENVRLAHRWCNTNRYIKEHA